MLSRLSRHSVPLVCALAAAALSLSSCSSDDTGVTDATATATTGNTDPAGDPSRFDTDDIAELLRAAPGRYDAAADRDRIVGELTQKVADGADTDGLFLDLLDLGAADFRPYQQYLDDTEVTYSGAGERPDGSDMVTGDASGLDVHVLFDASGSMGEAVDGGTKIDIAKTSVRDFLADAADAEGARVALRTYGNVAGDTCASTESLYPLGDYDGPRFTGVLDGLTPGENTPVALALDDVLADVDPTAEKTVVYVVSDGEETCGGDPVAAASRLAGSDADVVVNIIGFDVDDAEQQSLKDIAEAGNGTYHRADSGDELRSLLREERDRLSAAWSDWQAGGQALTDAEREEQLDRTDTLRDEADALARTEQAGLEAVVDALRDAGVGTPDSADGGDGVDISMLDWNVSQRGSAVRYHVNQEFGQLRYDIGQEGADLNYDIGQEGAAERYGLSQRETGGGS